MLARPPSVHGEVPRSLLVLNFGGSEMTYMENHRAKKRSLPVVHPARPRIPGMGLKAQQPQTCAGGVV
jgi:hypothetical protein